MANDIWIAAKKIVHVCVYVVTKIQVWLKGIFMYSAEIYVGWREGMWHQKLQIKQPTVTREPLT